MKRAGGGFDDTELVIALGREGKVLAKPWDAQRYPHTVAMAAKFEAGNGQTDYRKRKWIAEPPNGWTPLPIHPCSGCRRTYSLLSAKIGVSNANSPG
jgi:hypothetical protein